MTRAKKLYRDGGDIGIYGLYCEATGKWYVGASIRLESRTRKHILDLQNLRPHVMTEDAKRYGIESIKLYILERLTDKTQLAKREQYWIEKKNSLRNGYNQMRSGRSHGWLASFY